jgi:hypothetical protein
VSQVVGVLTQPENRRSPNQGEVFHTYSCHGRGIDMVNGSCQFLDLVPKAAMRTASNSQWSGYAGTISIEALTRPTIVWTSC